MNGIVELSVGGKTVTLQFGVQACMLFLDLAMKSSLSPETKENQIKLMCDLFYCGMYGYNLRKRMPLISYDASMDVFEDFSKEKTFDVDVERMWEVYSESKWGSELMAFGKESKKKLEEENKPLSQQEEVI